MGNYLADLEKAGIIKQDKQPATLERLKTELAAAEDDLVTGNAEVASVRLFRIVESPRYAKFDYAPDYVNAEFTLARALIKAGGYKSAERYLLRVLGRGTKTPFFAPAYRAMVDIALETREQAAILAVLDHFEKDWTARGGTLPRDSSAEHAYLAAKVAYEAGESARAESLFSSIDRQSRFYAAALYFRGLISARRGHLASARNSLCEIVAQVDQDRFTFFIDGRYYAIKDLAYLALGRISHEQERYDDAYYFYFRVPDDSEQLPNALFEASWSMFQAGEYEAAAAFLEEFDRSFSKTPLAPDVLLLQAMIDLKSCEFDRVRVTLDKLVKTYAPLQAQVAALLKDPDKRAAFYRRLLSKKSIGQPRDPIIELLKIDPRFYKFYADIVALDREAGLHPRRDRGVGRADRARGRQPGGLERDRGGAAGQRRRGVAAARGRRPADGGAGGRPRRRRAPGGPPGQRRRRPVREGGAGPAGDVRRSAQAARRAGHRHQHDREPGAGRPGQAAARAVAPVAAHAHRRRHRQEEEAGDRDRKPAQGALSRRAVRDPSARGVDGRRRRILAVRRGVLVGRV